MVALRDQTYEPMTRRETPRVLIVEDDPSTLWVLCALMRRLGFDCEGATNGREALELVGSFDPQAILLDVRLPVLDGLEVTRRLKADARTRGIPVLAVTCDTSSLLVASARRAGCAAVLTKPIVVQDLLNRLDRLLEPRPRGFPSKTGLHPQGPVD